MATLPVLLQWLEIFQYFYQMDKTYHNLEIIKPFNLEMPPVFAHLR